MPGSIDTLSIYQRLKSANLKDEAAQEIADVFRDVIESNLATKTDIELIRADIAATKADVELIRADIEYVKTDIEKVKVDIEKTIEIAVTKTKVEIIKWVAGMLVAQAAIVATLVKLL